MDADKAERDAAIAELRDLVITAVNDGFAAWQSDAGVFARVELMKAVEMLVDVLNCLSDDDAPTK